MMYSRVCLLVAVAVSGCGRIGYDPLVGDAMIDGAATDGALAPRDPALCNPMMMPAMCPHAMLTMTGGGPIDFGGQVLGDLVALPCGSGAEGAEWTAQVTLTTDATYDFEVTFDAPTADVAFIFGPACDSPPTTCLGATTSPVRQSVSLRAGEPLVLVVDVVGASCGRVFLRGTQI